MSGRFDKAFIFMAGIGAVYLLETALKAGHGILPLDTRLSGHGPPATAPPPPDDPGELLRPKKIKHRHKPDPLVAVNTPPEPKPPSTAGPAPFVRIRDTYKSRTFWTDAGYGAAKPAVEVVVDTRGDGDGKWRTYLEWQAPGSPRERGVDWGTIRAGAHTFHLPVEGLVAHPSGPFLDVLLNLRANAAHEGDGARGHGDTATVHLRSLRAVTGQEVNVLASGGRLTAPQTGPWFATTGAPTTATAPEVLHLTQPGDLARLGPWLRQLADFNIEEGIAPTSAAIHWVAHGQVVASLARGQLPPAEMTRISHLLGATLVYKGLAKAFIADLSTEARYIDQRLHSDAADPYVYMYNPTSPKLFFPVKRDFLVGSDEVHELIQKNGVALFSQPVDVLPGAYGH